MRRLPAEGLPRATVELIAEYALDVQGRRLTETTAAAGATTNTVTRYYTDDSDSPSWVVEQKPGQPAETTRYTPGLGSGLGATILPDGAVTSTSTTRTATSSRRS